MKKTLLLVFFASIAGMYIYVLQRPWGSVPAMGDLFDPVDGVYYLARNSIHAGEAYRKIPGLRGTVRIVRDERGVPHIFAENDLDAISALGYAVAQDRLFQLDFIPRVAAGQLSEILGPSMVETDRFLRETGMEWGTIKNMQHLEDEQGIQLDILRAYAKGVNAYINSLSKSELPLEFRLIGYEPEPFEEMDVIRLLQYMTFDLTFRSNDYMYNELEERLGSEQFKQLYPVFADLFIPIIPEKGGQIPPQERRHIYKAPRLTMHDTEAFGWLRNKDQLVSSFQKSLYEGFVHGKGSNNWATGPDRSTTGSVILAGDMHLSLWLPSLWYEAHMVSPSMNVYGVTIPGAPLIIKGYNDYVGWAFTNTGSDQIDYLALNLDDAEERYLFEGEYLKLDTSLDTIFVKDASPVVEKRYFSHWGPTLINEDRAVSLRWVAHDESRTLKALWHMNTATSMPEFQDALAYWDTPMQNILYGDVDGNVAIRSTGYLPIRRGGHGIGVLDGSDARAEWIGRVPFDELPYSYNPEQGYLTSTNQQPTDSTYPYYLGYDWGPSYRSLRIDALLSGKEKHSVSDIKRYQSDVYVVQRDLFVPLLDSMRGLSEKALELRKVLANWEGVSGVERTEPLLFDVYLDKLNKLVWDEELFIGLRKPGEDRLYALLRGELSPVWLDIEHTHDIEDAHDVMKLALEETVMAIDSVYGWNRDQWRWGDHHKIIFRHYTRSEALKALWRGPYEYPGFEKTLSPAEDFETTKSASWRMVVDFSTQPPSGYGVYPGGQSGNPFSSQYDNHLDTYLEFEHFKLNKPASQSDMDAEHISSVLTLEPSAANR